MYRFELITAKDEQELFHQLEQFVISHPLATIHYIAQSESASAWSVGSGVATRGNESWHFTMVIFYKEEMIP